MINVLADSHYGAQLAPFSVQESHILLKALILKKFVKKTYTARNVLYCPKLLDADDFWHP